LSLLIPTFVLNRLGEIMANRGSINSLSSSQLHRVAEQIQLRLLHFLWIALECEAQIARIHVGLA
jgi:hypothetical protein